MTRSFERFAGALAVAAGAGGFLYSLFFVLYLERGSVGSAKVAAALLFGGGLVVSVVAVALWGRLRAVDPGFAAVALVLGVLSGAGSAIHGAYDLANFIKPPGVLPAAVGNLPNPVDPRGLMTFGLAGVAVLLASWLIVRGAPLPERLGRFGFLVGALLVVVYLGRLIVLNPKNPFLLTVAVVSGFLTTPAWFVWLGMNLRRTETSSGTRG
jgi:hypothetical protein